MTKVISQRVLTREGSSAISIGGEVVYVLEFNVKVNTIANVAASEGTDTVFRRKKE